MTQTLTTEQKTILIDTCNVMINREATSDYSANLREVAKVALSTLTANRETQPSITDEVIDRIVVPLSPDGLDEEKHHCEWHLYHDRERIRKELREYIAAPPAPAVVNGRTAEGWMAEALLQKKIADDLRKSAPAVPGIDELRLTFERSERESDDGFNLHKYGIGYADEATQARWESWLSCRAAMLAQPVSQGGKLSGNVRETLTLALQAMEFMGDTLNNIDAVCTEDVEYVTPAFNAVRGLLTAAPEGGNEK